MEEIARNEVVEKVRRQEDEGAMPQEVSRKATQESLQRAAEGLASKAVDDEVTTSAEEARGSGGGDKIRRETVEVPKVEVDVGEGDAQEHSGGGADKNSGQEDQAKMDVEDKAKNDVEEGGRKEAEEIRVKRVDDKVKREAQEGARLDDVMRNETENNTKRDVEGVARKEYEENGQEDAAKKADQVADDVTRLDVEPKARKQAHEAESVEAKRAEKTDVATSLIVTEEAIAKGGVEAMAEGVSEEVAVRSAAEAAATEATEGAAQDKVAAEQASSEEAGFREVVVKEAAALEAAEEMMAMCSADDDAARLVAEGVAVKEAVEEEATRAAAKQSAANAVADAAVAKRASEQAAARAAAETRATAGEAQARVAAEALTANLKAYDEAKLRQPRMPEGATHSRSMVEVTVRHATKAAEVSLQVQKSATIGEVKKALIHKVGRSGRNVRLAEKSGGTFKFFNEAEMLGKKRELCVLGLDLSGGSAMARAVCIGREMQYADVRVRVCCTRTGEEVEVSVPENATMQQVRHAAAKQFSDPTVVLLGRLCKFTDEDEAEIPDTEQLRGRWCLAVLEGGGSATPSMEALAGNVEAIAGKKEEDSMSRVANESTKGKEHTMTRDAMQDKGSSTQGPPRRDADELSRKEVQAKQGIEEEARRHVDDRRRNEMEEIARNEVVEKVRRQEDEGAMPQEVSRKATQESLQRAAEGLASKAVDDEVTTSAEEARGSGGGDKIRRETVEVPKVEVDVGEGDAQEHSGGGADKNSGQEDQAKMDVEDKAKNDVEEGGRKEAEEIRVKRVDDKVKREAQEGARLDDVMRNETENNTKRDVEGVARKEYEENGQEDAAKKADQVADDVTRLDVEPKARKQAHEAESVEAKRAEKTDVATSLIVTEEAIAKGGVEAMTEAVSEEVAVRAAAEMAATEATAEVVEAKTAAEEASSEVEAEKIAVNAGSAETVDREVAVKEVAAKEAKGDAEAQQGARLEATCNEKENNTKGEMEGVARKEPKENGNKDTAEDAKVGSQDVTKMAVEQKARMQAHEAERSEAKKDDKKERAGKVKPNIDTMFAGQNKAVELRSGSFAVSGADRKEAMMRLTIRHATKQDEISVAVRASATMLEVKHAISRQVGRPVRPSMRLAKKVGNTLAFYSDKESLGGMQELVVLGFDISSVDAMPRSSYAIANVTVTVVDATNGDELRVVVPETATMLEVREALLAKQVREEGGRASEAKAVSTSRHLAKLDGEEHGAPIPDSEQLMGRWRLMLLRPQPVGAPEAVDLVQVTVHDEVNGSEVKVQVPRTALLRQVKDAVCLLVDSRDVEDAGTFIERDGGVTVSLTDTEPLGDRRSLLMLGTMPSPTVRKEAAARTGFTSDSWFHPGSHSDNAGQRSRDEQQRLRR